MQCSRGINRKWDFEVYLNIKKEMLRGKNSYSAWTYI